MSNTFDIVFKLDYKARCAWLTEELSPFLRNIGWEVIFANIPNQRNEIAGILGYALTASWNFKEKAELSVVEGILGAMYRSANLSDSEWRKVGSWFGSSLAEVFLELQIAMYNRTLKLFEKALIEKTKKWERRCEQFALFLPVLSGAEGKVDDVVLQSYKAGVTSVLELMEEFYRDLLFAQPESSSVSLPV